MQHFAVRKDDKLKEFPAEERKLKGLNTKSLHIYLGLHGQLQEYLKDSKCLVSKHISENSIKSFIIGRKNRLFCDSPQGAASIA